MSVTIAQSAIVWLQHDLYQEVRAGDMIAYPQLSITSPTAQGELTVHARASQTTRVVTEIRFTGDPGFAEIGPKMEIALDDGSILTGDGENGFRGFVVVAPIKHQK